MNKKPLIIIAGPTAVGKTEFSIKLAKLINGEIISADSMQVYKGMNIGTAKITPEEMQGVRHYLIDELEPTEEFNVYEFQTRAKKYIEDILGREKIPIIVGGTGFYIQSVLYDIDFTEDETDKDYRHELEEYASKYGPDYLFEKLREVDPESCETIHKNNIKRVIRALEYYHDTNEKISVHNMIQKEKESPYDYSYIILTRNRDTVYERINKRVDIMIKDGLVDEVKGLLDSGVSKDSLSMQGLGYKEIAAYIDGGLSLDAAVELLKKNTRHFAKRQITWFKREPLTTWLNYEDFESIDEMVNIVGGKYINV